MLDALLDLLDRHAVGLTHIAAVGVDHFKPVLRHRTRPMHHQVRRRNALMDRLDPFDGQDLAGRRPREFVCTVACADRNCQRIHLRLFHEVRSLVRISQQLAVIKLALGTRAVFFSGHPGFETAQTSKFALHRNTARMGHVYHTPGHIDVVFIGGRRLHVLFERAVHHDRREAELNGTLTDRGARAMILMHYHRYLRPLFDGGQYEVTQERCAGIFTGPG